jgi:hypothetical protein
MTFSIRFHDESEFTSETSGGLFIEGEIQIGEFRETFDSCVDHWTRRDYEEQWKDGVRRIVEGGQKTSGLVVDVANLGTGHGTVTWWPLQCEGRTILAQQHIFPLGRASRSFDVNMLYSRAEQRMIDRTRPGDTPPSQWRIEVQELKAFLRASSEG